MGIASFVCYIHVHNLFICDTIFVRASADSAKKITEVSLLSILSVMYTDFKESRRRERF